MKLPMGDLLHQLRATGYDEAGNVQLQMSLPQMKRKQQKMAARKMLSQEEVDLLGRTGQITKTKKVTEAASKAASKASKAVSSASKALFKPGGGGVTRLTKTGTVKFLGDGGFSRLRDSGNHDEGPEIAL